MAVLVIIIIYFQVHKKIIPLSWNENTCQDKPACKQSERG